MLFAANGLVHGTAQLVSVRWTALCIVVAADLPETVRQGTPRVLETGVLVPIWAQIGFKCSG